VGAGRLPEEPAEPAEKKPGWPRRLLRALGDTWGRLPERLSRVSSPAPKTVAFTPSANGHAMNGNGHAPAMIGNKNGTKNGSKNKASKVRGAPADAPYSLAGSRFAKK